MLHLSPEAGSSMQNRLAISSFEHKNRRLGRKVKKMIGGVEGWKDEGFDLAKGEAAHG